MRTNPFARDTGILTEEELVYIENKAVETFRYELKARKLFNVRQLAQDGGVREYRYYVETDPSESVLDMNGTAAVEDLPEKTRKTVKMPVNHKEAFIGWRDLAASRREGMSLLDDAIRTATRCLAETADRLLISGETTGWNALGIEGLFTATGRTTVAASGNWPANFIADINTGQGALNGLGFEGVEPILIAPPAVITALNGAVANTEITYKKFAINNDILADVMGTSSAYAADGGVDSALLIVPGSESFYAVQDLPLEVINWKDRMNNVYLSIRETIAPVIARPTAVYEISDIVLA